VSSFYTIVTDFGVVSLSSKTEAFLYSLDSDWKDLLTNKRRRGKNAKRIRLKFQQIERTVMLLSEMAFASGEDLEKF
jgi:hypothetical protein